jgi:hypothetical protein
MNSRNEAARAAVRDRSILIKVEGKSVTETFFNSDPVGENQPIWK